MKTQQDPALSLVCRSRLANFKRAPMSYPAQDLADHLAYSKWVKDPLSQFLTTPAQAFFGSGALQFLQFANKTHDLLPKNGIKKTLIIVPKQPDTRDISRWKVSTISFEKYANRQVGAHETPRDRG